MVALLALFVNVVDAKVKDVTKLQIGVKVIPRQRYLDRFCAGKRYLYGCSSDGVMPVYAKRISATFIVRLRVTSDKSEHGWAAHICLT